jgi:hypothetical protein
MATWNPLAEPSAHIDHLLKWRSALRISSTEPVDNMQMDVYGAKSNSVAVQVAQM